MVFICNTVARISHTTKNMAKEIYTFCSLHGIKFTLNSRVDNNRESELSIEPHFKYCMGIYCTCTCIGSDYKWTLNTDMFPPPYRYIIKDISKVCPPPYLAVSVGILLKVLLFTNDRLCDDVVILDTHCGREGGAVRLCQPGDFLGLLVVLVEEIITNCYYLHINHWSNDVKIHVKLCLHY